MGISDFGEMRVLTRIVRPTIAVFTVIGHAHLEFLHDRQGVFRAKTEMLESMSEDAVVLVNGDDDLLRALNCRQRKLSFGLSDGCDFRATDLRVDSEGQSCCTIVHGERRIPVTISAFGQHMVYAALEGAAVGVILGLSDREIAEGIGSFSPVGRRSAVTETGKITLVDDSYNANPDSVKCGIDSLMELPGRHVCILGDMLELGPGEKDMHRDVGEYAARKGVDLVLCSGPLAAEIAAGAGERGKWFTSTDALIAALPDLIRQDDRVLVKASRGMHFEQAAEALKCL
jgi:UDP-N-acetylmuramoyl-tripeptide--D-alanyl-D-alanine ligase